MEQNNNDQYTHCLNCGEELKGAYCYNCGQQVRSEAPRVMDFILEYANNAFIWDRKFLFTIKNLITRPGFLSLEFSKGRIVSYTNPLKLNMFLLLVFITMFLLFSNANKISDAVDNIANDEEQLAEMVMTAVAGNSASQKALASAQYDTIMLKIPLTVIEKHSDVIIKMDGDSVVGQDGGIFYQVAIPGVMLDDGLIIEDSEGEYVFNNNSDHLQKLLYIDSISQLWNKGLDFLTKYFPIIILFTIPVLSLAVRIANRKFKMPKIHTFVFSLHFTAFVELLLIFIYVCFLLFPPIRGVLGWVFAALAFIYMTIAQRRFFKGTSWIMAGFKSLLINVTYAGICFAVFVVVIFALIAAFVIQNLDVFSPGL